MAVVDWFLVIVAAGACSWFFALLFRQRGERGYDGPMGEQGVPGLNGPSGRGITRITWEGSALRVVYTNGDIQRVTVPVHDIACTAMRMWARSLRHYTTDIVDRWEGEERLQREIRARAEAQVES